MERSTKTRWRRSRTRLPLVGIGSDVIEPKPGSVRSTVPLTYVSAVAAAGGQPIILAPTIALIEEQIALCDAIVLIGGDDPRMEPFGATTHARATPVHPRRQEYEVALLRSLAESPQTPVLGICLGMQYMALLAGASLNQHMPDTVPTAADHTDDRPHAIAPAEGAPLAGGTVTSHHHQCVDDPGGMRVVARAPDGVIEAIDDPSRPFYLGVQWHPERTEVSALGADLFRRLVDNARGPA